MTRSELSAIRKNEQLHREYIQRFRAGDKKALEILLALHEPYIFKMSRRYAGRLYKGEIEDLLQEGRLGVIRAYEKWDDTKDNKVFTYIASYIHGYLIHFLKSKTSVVRVPYLKTRVGHQYVSCFTDLTYSYHSDPIPFESTIPDLAESVEDRMDHSDIDEVMRLILKDMPTREADFVQRNIMNGETLESIGRDYGVSRERVRQIIKQRLTRVTKRNPINGKSLADWISEVRATVRS